MKIDNNKGFNLLMLCIVVMALSILMSAVLGFYSITNYKRRLQTTNERFQTIDLAIKNYIFKNNKFPCPAPLNCNKDSCKASEDKIGISKLDDSENCNADNQGVFESTNPDTTKKIYYGNIPAITLGLDNTYISDGWGNKIVYVIPKELTEKNASMIFFYAKHNDDNEITIEKEGGETETITLDRKYVKDGIIYLFISFNKNRQGAYAYSSKKANYFSGKKNNPVQSFEIDTNVSGLLFFKRDIKNFSIGKIEEEMQICPEKQFEHNGVNFTFKSSKYGEIVFSEEMCPSSVSSPTATQSNYYYLSDYRSSNGTLIDNRVAIRCGKNGKWEENLIYSCQLLPKCKKPQEESKYSLLDWSDFNYTIVNMGEVKDKNDIIRLKCICIYDVDHTYTYGSEQSHYNCKLYEI